MLQVTSEHPLGSIEAAIRRAAQQNGASVLTVAHVGHHLPGGSGDAFVFGICCSELYQALLEGDIRLSAFLPCRVAAYSAGTGTTLISLSPVEFCRVLNRPDLAPLAVPLEELLLRLMQSTAHLSGLAADAYAGAHHGGLGATEDQMNLRGSLPQRIDCRGSKVEDLAGTGGHDSQGG